MHVEVVVEEPVQVLTRLLPSGQLVPTSFVWRERTRYVMDVGRQWEERVEGRPVRCYLVRTVDLDTYELCWDPAADTWTIRRAWLSNLV